MLSTPVAITAIDFPSSKDGPSYNIYDDIAFFLELSLIGGPCTGASRSDHCGGVPEARSGRNIYSSDCRCYVPTAGWGKLVIFSRVRLFGFSLVVYPVVIPVTAFLKA